MTLDKKFDLERINRELAMKHKLEEYDEYPPLELKYFCKIHGVEETAKQIGRIEYYDDVLILYNTPERYTLEYKTIMELVYDLKDDEWWKRYSEGRK